MPALKLNRILSGGSETRPLVAKALEIDALSRHCNEYLPFELAPRIHAANLKDGRLVLLASDAAAAAKLKLLGEGLRDYLIKQGAKVNSVSVRVQPGEREPVDVAPQKQARLSAGAIQALAQLRDGLPESAARSALEALLQRHAGAEPTKKPPSVARKSAGRT